MGCTGRRHRTPYLGWAVCLSLSVIPCGPPAAAQAIVDGTTPVGGSSIETVVVLARSDLLGEAATSSQGIVAKQELALLPAYRPGQLLETVPGLVVTMHSGEGKAGQYLLRGFNLDHGTDLATYIDDMPVNERTHAHGQGYTDLNFFIPELAAGINYTKGPYYAAEGDFASVGSDRIGYLDAIENQVSVSFGSLGEQRLFGAGATEAGGGTLLGAGELVHYDGPWTHPDDQRKANAVLRYSDGANGHSLTAMYYGGLWNATNDQPLRAYSSAYMSGIGGEAIGRYGALDPSDGGSAQRYSLSGQYRSDAGRGHIDANAYVISNRLTLWNDFTHFLVDPVQGDQHAQNEVRTTLGGAADYAESDNLLGFATDLLAGAETRTDIVHVGLAHTERRRFLATVENDRVDEGSVGFYAQATTHWTEWLRSVLGGREDVFWATDRGTNQGEVSEALFQPKGSLILSPADNLEFYVSAGRGFHSDDVRGATKDGAPLLAKSTGEEIGVRATPMSDLTLTATVFRVDFQSELTYDPDIGENVAGPASKRDGVELNLTYAPYSWLEVYGSIAATHARFKTGDNDGYGHIGEYIANAPVAIGQFGVYFPDLGRWSGGLNYRYLGSYPLTPDDSIRDAGYGEWSVEAGYALTADWKIAGAVYNLLNTRADAAAFYYGDRVTPAEPVADPVNGNGDVHVHPLEPVSFRFTLTRYW